MGKTRSVAYSDSHTITSAGSRAVEWDSARDAIIYFSQDAYKSSHGPHFCCWQCGSIQIFRPIHIFFVGPKRCAFCIKVCRVRSGSSKVDLINLTNVISLHQSKRVKIPDLLLILMLILHGGSMPICCSFCGVSNNTTLISALGRVFKTVRKMH